MTFLRESFCSPTMAIDKNIQKKQLKPTQVIEVIFGSSKI